MSLFRTPIGERRFSKPVIIGAASLAVLGVSNIAFDRIYLPESNSIRNKIKLGVPLKDGEQVNLIGTVIYNGGSRGDNFSQDYYSLVIPSGDKNVPPCLIAVKVSSDEGAGFFNKFGKVNETFVAVVSGTIRKVNNSYTGGASIFSEKFGRILPTYEIGFNSEESSYVRRIYTMRPDWGRPDWENYKSPLERF
jgi:hypothetical protein